MTKNVSKEKHKNSQFVYTRKKQEAENIYNFSAEICRMPSHTNLTSQ